MTETRVVLSTREKDYVALPVGTEVGRYTIRAVLGQGGFGVTYRAHDRSLNREVAIKEYLPTAFAVRGDGFIVVPTSTRSAEDFSWGRQRFTEEGRMLASFQQAPGIVKVYDFLEANGTAYIVMELVHGITLGQRIDRGTPLSAEETERILRPLLDGLAQVHAAGIVHRDIKPDNILLDAEGRPSLIDFGAARAAMAGRTEAVTALYTPGYAAVEQFNDARQGPWTDIYGLSTTLYHAITLNKAPTAIDRALDDTCTPLSKLRPAGYPRELLAGLDRGMAIRSEDRPQSIDAWKPMFAAAPQARPQSQPVDRRTLRLAAYGALGVLLLAGAAGGTWLLLSSLRPADRPATQAPADQEAERQAIAAQQQRERAEAEARSRAAAEEARLKAESEAASRAKAEDEARQRAAEEDARRRAEADAASRARAEDEARQRAAREEARRAAEAEAAARAKAADEARQRAAAEEARRRAEADAAARAKAEEDARLRAEAEQARRRAEQEARDRAAAEAEARKRQQEAGATTRAETERLGKAAEAGEAALRMTIVDRQRLQVALTARGFDTRGADGALGPRSREMIAAWQKARGQAATGYLDAAQRQQLLTEGAAAIARFDEEQKKAEEAARRAPEANAGRPATRPAQPGGGSAAAFQQAGGAYAGSFTPPSEIDVAGANGRIGLTLQNGAGSGTIGLSGGMMPKRGAFSLAVAPDGSVSGQGTVPNNRGPALAVTLQGRVEGTRILLEFVGLRAPLVVTLDKAD